MAAGSAVGAACVVLDDAVKPLGLTGDEQGRRLNFLAESLGAVGGRSGPHVFAGGERAQTPLSPVHIRGVRLADGAAQFHWIRRGRVDADGWDGRDIPRDEPDEGYRVEILGTRGVVVRRVEVEAPLFLYPASDELADFGSQQPSLTLSIRQIGQAVPLGIAALATIAF